MSEHPHHQPQGPWQPTNPPAPPVAKPSWFMRHKILTGLAGLRQLRQEQADIGKTSLETARRDAELIIQDAKSRAKGLIDTATAQGAALLEQAKVDASRTKQAAERAEVVITSLPNGALVAQVVDELLAADSSPRLLIDVSTIAVAEARELAQRVAVAGAERADVFQRLPVDHLF